MTAGNIIFLLGRSSTAFHRAGFAFSLLVGLLFTVRAAGGLFRSEARLGHRVYNNINAVFTGITCPEPLTFLGNNTASKADRVINISGNNMLTASSRNPRNPIDNAVDGDPESFWQVGDDKPGTWLQVDLGESGPTIAASGIIWERLARQVEYQLDGSSGGKSTTG